MNGGYSNDGRVRVGRLGEERTTRWYQRNGWTVLARNWRCREGELDLVVRRGDTIVFCEVKTRLGSGYGAAEAVTPTKQRRIRVLALRFLDATGERAPHLRFDVATVDRSGTVQVIEAAF